jgi:hypothetical protein
MMMSWDDRHKVTLPIRAQATREMTVIAPAIMSLICLSMLIECLYFPLSIVYALPGIVMHQLC